MNSEQNVTLNNTEKKQSEITIDDNRMKKYKSLFHSKKTSSTKELSQHLDQFLENEKPAENSSWNKLNKTEKLAKLSVFLELYAKENGFDENEKILLSSFFLDCLDKKKLQKTKDVIYDIKTGLLKNIPGLFYNKSTKHFTIKNVEKKTCTLKTHHNLHHKSSTLDKDAPAKTVAANEKDDKTSNILE